MEAPTRALARWAARLGWDDAPAGVRDRLLLALYDTLSVTAAGARLPENAALVRAWEPPPGPAPIVGTGLRTTADAAHPLDALDALTRTPRTRNSSEEDIDACRRHHPDPGVRGRADPPAGALRPADPAAAARTAAKPRRPRCRRRVRVVVNGCSAVELGGGWPDGVSVVDPTELALRLLAVGALQEVFT